uniref:Uncharacterized protein n=1 Tax=Arundo donax TaxID=35708 RepID=A0A0A9HTL3_ARUDO
MRTNEYCCLGLLPPAHILKCYSYRTDKLHLLRFQACYFICTHSQ